MVGRDGTGRDKIVRECKTVVKDVLVVESRPVDNIVHRYDLLSHPVVKKKNTHLTSPSSRKLEFTVPSRRKKKYLLSRPDVKNYIHRPRPRKKPALAVPSCRRRHSRFFMMLWGLLISSALDRSLLP